MVHRGEIPIGKKVLHKCDFGLCFNPRHLFIGTQRDNVLDMRRKGRGFAATKAAGYSNPIWAKGEENPRSVLTDNTVRKIRRLYKPYSKKFNTLTLAARFGVGKTIIGQIIRGERWSHVK